LEITHGNWEESCAKLPKVLGALQSCVSKVVVVARTAVFEEKKWYLAKNV